jgi:hypothetical protein
MQHVGTKPVYDSYLHEITKLHYLVPLKSQDHSVPADARNDVQSLRVVCQHPSISCTISFHGTLSTKTGSSQQQLPIIRQKVHGTLVQIENQNMVNLTLSFMYLRRR